MKAGVKRFIPSEYGNNTLNAKVVEMFSPKMDVKVEVLEYLKKQEGNRMSWTGLATGGFFDWVRLFKLWGIVSKEEGFAELMNDRV